MWYDNRGCSSSPQLFDISDIVTNWSPGTATGPTQYFNSLCRFNLSDIIERQYIDRFRAFEVPFIIYGIPALEETGKVWTDTYLQKHLGEDQFKGQISSNNHFMYYKKHKDESEDSKDAGPTYTEAKWTYPEFLNLSHANENPKASDIHYYFFLNLKMKYNITTLEASPLDFIRTSLPFFNHKYQKKSKNIRIYLYIMCLKLKVSIAVLGCQVLLQKDIMMQA